MSKTNRRVSFIGETNGYSPYGIGTTKLIAYDLGKDDFVLVASCLDREMGNLALLSALNSGGKVIGVFPGGFNYLSRADSNLTKKILDNDGMILSLLPPNCSRGFQSDSFVAQLGHTLIVTEASVGESATFHPIPRMAIQNWYVKQMGILLSTTCSARKDARAECE